MNRMTFQEAKEALHTELDSFSDQEILAGVVVVVQYIDQSTGEHEKLYLQTDGLETVDQALSEIDKAKRPFDLLDPFPDKI
tara:strand:+ start:281 stop:523 length:243 start_codon:yes stop_codon:yes gene_type:complete